MSETQEYAWNFQTNMAFVTNRTLHKVRERDGKQVTTQCGVEFKAEQRDIKTDLENVREKYKCGRCFR